MNAESSKPTGRAKDVVPPSANRRGGIALALLLATAWSRPALAADAGATAKSDEVQKLDAVNVNGERYKPVPLEVPKTGMRMLGFRMEIPPFLLPNQMDRYIVTATRTPQPPDRVAATAHAFDESAVATTPAATVDSVLRSEPSFGLFRRTDSLTANPTTQGVSLRGLGPSGASRSLVLLDGVPLNDPFGGWVLWSQIPRDSIVRIEVVPGGGASAWGNAALGGVIQVFTLPVKTEPMVIDQPPAPLAWGERGTARLSAVAGDFDTRSASFAVTRPVAKSVVQVLGEDFSTAGFSVVAPESRETIDVPAWSRHRTLTARWRMALGAKAELTATARSFEEFRGNGTPYQRNGTREKFASVQAAAQPSDRLLVTAIAYAQDQSFASTFSSVNATRTAETPASDQFAVPAVAVGASATATWSHQGGSRTNVGADFRTVHGETRENYSYSKTDFTRQRVAGGTQAFGGWFLLHEQPLPSAVRLTIGGRLDEAHDGNGHRRETDRATGAMLRDDRYASQYEAEFSPTAGAVWQPNKAWRLHANAQQSFRRPTLNELYRPFRQGSNVVEANPELKTERATSAEIGAEWTLIHQGHRDTNTNRGKRTIAVIEPLITFSATAFWNDLHNAVSNVTIAHGPGTFPVFGQLPTGTVGRQRLNLDRTEVRGAEFSATWQANSALSWTAAFQYDDAFVRRASVAPALVGKRVAEVPTHSATLTATWRAPAKLVFAPRLRWIGRQWDDDENTLRLGEAVVVDCGVSRALTTHLELFLNVENVGNARVETARSTDGVFNVGTPRFAFGGLRGRW